MVIEKSKLALLGGSPVISKPFSKYSTIDESDALAAHRVIMSGTLSDYIGDAGEKFLGGREIRNFEQNFSEKFNVSHSVAVNSWTSGLWVAAGALELEPGSEVITSTWTMAASATTLLHWNLIPVFADIDPRSFNLDPIDVETKITQRTRAIVAPDIFGQSADVEALLRLCLKYDLVLISDSAQSPLARRNNYFAGTASHIGGFSFNYHKHIHTGEGGMLVTNNSLLCERMQLLRNHGEVVVARDPSFTKGYGIMGMNLRLGEIEGAIGQNQLLKLDNAIISRQDAADQFTKGVSSLNGLRVPFVEPENSHVYYVYGMQLDLDILQVERSIIVKALQAEGVSNLFAGYQNLHLLPLFREQLTYRKNPIPYSLVPKKRSLELRNPSLPISEQLHNSTFIGINWCANTFTELEVKELIQAFRKVWGNLDILRSL